MMGSCRVADGVKVIIMHHNTPSHSVRKTNSYQNKMNFKDSFDKLSALFTRLKSEEEVLHWLTAIYKQKLI